MKQKSPIVYSNIELYWSIAAGVITSTILALTTYDIMSIWQIVGYYLTITGGLVLMALGTRRGTIYTRKVANSVEPENLTPGRICYLNGEFEAKFLYKDGYYGQFVFKIEGLSDEVSVYPGQVRKYFSAEKEV